MSEDTSDESKFKRPLGVWLLTGHGVIISSVFMIGLITGILAQIDAKNGSVVINAETIFLFILNLGIIISAMGTWLGKNQARIYFVLLIILLYIVQLILLIPTDNNNQFGVRLVRNIITPLIYAWYFRRNDIRNLYTKNDDT